MTAVEADVLIRQPIERVFGYLADMSHIPQWMSEDFTSVTRGPFQQDAQGSRYSYIAKGGARGDWEWVDFDPPKKLTWSGPPAKVGFGSVECRGEYLLSSTDQGTRLVVRLEPRFGGGLKILAPLSVSQIRRKLPRQLYRLKNLLELQLL